MYGLVHAGSTAHRGSITLHESQAHPTGRGGSQKGKPVSSSCGCKEDLYRESQAQSQHWVAR